MSSYTPSVSFLENISVCSSNGISLLIDPLHIAYNFNATLKQNYLKKILLKIESYRLMLHEKSIVSCLPSYLVNPNDIKLFGRAKALRLLPFKPQSNALERATRIIRNCSEPDFSNKSRILILGNFDYDPNFSSLIGIVKFFYCFNKDLSYALKKSASKIVIAGYMSPTTMRKISKLLHDFQLQSSIGIHGPYDQISILASTAVATITADVTPYGRQTKQFTSVNSFLPIIHILKPKI